jgi:hypothetical protein
LSSAGACGSTEQDDDGPGVTNQQPDGDDGPDDGPDDDG